MNNRVRMELEKINIPENLHERAIKGVAKAKEEMNQMSKKSFLQNKVTYSICAVVLVCVLFIGSGFFSTAISNVLAKVPYLNMFFETKTVETIITDELKKEGFKIEETTQAPYPEKVFNIDVKGSQSYVDDVKGDIQKIAEKILFNHNYDAYSIKVKKYKPFHRENLDEENKKLEAESDILMNDINRALKEAKIDYLTLGVMHNKFKHVIDISIANTETRIDEMKKIIQKIIDSKNFGEFSIELNKVDMEKMKKELQWTDVISVIHEGLRARKEYHTKGLAYSFKTDTIQIIVKTTVKSTDKQAEEIAVKIENTVNEFIQSNEIQEKVKGEPYTIIVRSSDQKKMN